MNWSCSACGSRDWPSLNGCALCAPEPQDDDELSPDECQTGNRCRVTHDAEPPIPLGVVVGVEATGSGKPLTP
jgi:hypothetical protein